METIDIRTFIHEAKLIIGNGFDLQCDLHSSYQDYFKFKEKQYSWFDGILRTAFTNHRYYGAYDANDFPQTMPENLNFWDLVFYLLSQKTAEIQNWYDVEEAIKKCLFEERQDWSISFLSLSKWVSRHASEEQYNYLNYEQSDLFLFKHFLLDQIGRGLVYDAHSFFLFLLGELNKFELDFIEYLKKDIKRIDYQSKSSELVSKIVGNSQYRVTEINSFNYTRFQYASALFRNINGDFDYPIFGVDSSGISDIDDERRIFTKQYRKLELLLRDQSKPSTCREECVFFYGHSFNEQDYDYFFTLFDRLDLLNESNRELVFGYSIFDKEREKEIERSMIEKIYAMFFAYERSKGIQNPRLITKLISERRASFKLIDKI